MESHRNFFGAVILATLLIAQQAWGQSPTGNDNPTGVAGDYGGSVTTGGGYDPYTGNARRVIDDIVVPGAAGAYPLKWTRFLNTRSGWTNSYQYSLSIRSMSNDWHYYDNPYEGPDGHVAYPDGRQVDLWYQDATHWDAPGADGPQGIGHRVEATGGGNYKLIMSDGGQVLFATQSYWNGGGWVQGIFSIAIVDPYGQTTTFGRDTQGRLTTVTEPAGRYLQVYYGDHGVSTVQAWDGRGNLMESVSYGYTTSQVYWQFVNSYVSVTNLTQAYYDDGAVATYTYRNSNVADNTFNTILTKLVETCDDQRFAGPMKKIKYEYMPHDGNPSGVWGQIRAERNATTDQIVSQVAYPAYPDASGNRYETRGDGPSRLMVCGPLGWTSWTDYQNHSSSIAYPAGFNGWVYTDARGNTTAFERVPAVGAIRRITHPPTFPGENSTIEYAYSDDANPYYRSGAKDENGYWTYFDRDGNNRVWRIRYPDSGTEEFTYNGFGQVLTHKLRTGGTETFTYDTRGLKQTSYPPATGSDPAPSNHPTRYFYYDNGPNTDRLLRVQDPRGNSTTYEYNQRGLVTRVTHQDGTYTQSAYNLDGTLAWTADENHPNASWNENERTRYTYDEYKRVLTVTNPMNETTTNYYGLDWANPLVHTTNSLKWTKSPMQKNVVYDYNENLRKRAQTVAAGTSDIATTWFDYDEVGNLAWTRDPRGNVTTFGYDARNRKIWMDDPIPSDRNSTGHTMNWEYDAVGNKKKETRADNLFRSWNYDSMNQVSDTYGFANEHTHYDRDAAGNVTWITDAKGAQYACYYDQLNRKVSQWYPVDATGVSRYDAWYRDIAGNIIRHDSPEGNVQIFEYDNRNRMTHSYWWSNVGPSVVTGYDAASRVTGITTNNGETTIGYGYDDANRQISEDQTLAGYPMRRVETPRDADGNRTSLNVQNAYYIGYSYTQRNQLASIGNFANFTYDAAGNMTRRQGIWCYPNDANFEYDGLNRTTMAEQGGASGWIFARSHYQYDKLGRETATWRDEDTGSGPGWGERFEYENSDQVKKVFYNAQNAWSETPQNAANVQEYGYSADKLNRTSVSNNGVTTGYTMPNGMNQYTNVGKQAVGYDNHFNIASYNGLTFTYDAENHLVGGSMQATYDGLGRCVRRTTAGGTILFTYDGWKPILEWCDWGGWLAWHVYGAGSDEILARHDWAGGNWIYKQDKQGSVVALLDGGGTVQEKYSYDAFGRPTISDYWGNVRTDGSGRPVSWCGNRFMFTGREYIAELGIYDYRHRMYHPGLGRFLQSDPTGFDAGDMNLFRYCGDDPVDRSDPTGLFDMWSNLTKFFNGNPSMDVVQAAWNERQQQTRIVLELVPAGDRHISTGDFKLKNGSQGVGLTEADFTVREPAKQEDGSSKVTGVYTLNVKYPDGPRSTAGPKTRQFGYSKEWEHAVPYDSWFGRALVTVREMNSKFHFRSPAEARDSLDRQLREGFNQAYRDSLNLHANGRHDSPFKYEE